MTKKPRRPGTRAGTSSGRRADSLGADPYEGVEISTGDKPARATSRPSIGEITGAAAAALDDLIAAAEASPMPEMEGREFTSRPGDDDDASGGASDQPIELPPKVKRRPPTQAESPAARALDGGETSRARAYDVAAAVHRAKTTRAPTAAPLEEGQLVEETVLPEVPVLEFAVYEEAAHLSAAQSAVVAAGHVVGIAATGRDGLAQVVEAVRSGAVDAVLVALPGGEPVIDASLALEPRRPVVIASVADSAVQAIHRATTAGADLATTRPYDVDRLAPVLLAAARLHGERAESLAVRGSEQVLRARLDEIADFEGGGLESFEMFQRALEREIKRAKRYEYPLSVALFAVEIAPPPPPPGIRGILRARAGNALINSIRDIDLATQIDQERFLVLLPYTDLDGATHLARRVIAAVAEGDPVISAGRAFPPKVVGAVAGAREGQQLSFARLMKDATRALEQARRDGAELAVQP
jgi:hypothetical protein